MTLYRIKPLAWNHYTAGTFWAETVMGPVIVQPAGAGWVWCHRFAGRSCTDGGPHALASADEAKAAAEAFCRGRLLAALEPVEAAVFLGTRVATAPPIPAEDLQ